MVFFTIQQEKSLHSTKKYFFTILLDLLVLKPRSFILLVITSYILVNEANKNITIKGRQSTSVINHNDDVEGSKDTKD